ncbi:hypothetical protein D3C86_1127750 [compost metagenome]
MGRLHGQPYRHRKTDQQSDEGGQPGDADGAQGDDQVGVGEGQAVVQLPLEQQRGVGVTAEYFVHPAIGVGLHQRVTDDDQDRHDQKQADGDQRGADTEKALEGPPTFQCVGNR